MAYIAALRTKRQRAGLSQNALASLSGVDRQTVSRCENGYTIRKEKAFQILNALNAHKFYWGNLISEDEIKDGGKTGPFPPSRKANAVGIDEEVRD